MAHIGHAGLFGVGLEDVEGGPLEILALNALQGCARREFRDPRHINHRGAYDIIVLHFNLKHLSFL